MGVSFLPLMFSHTHSPPPLETPGRTVTDDVKEKRKGERFIRESCYTYIPKKKLYQQFGSIVHFTYHFHRFYKTFKF